MQNVTAAQDTFIDAAGNELPDDKKARSSDDATVITNACASCSNRCMGGSPVPLRGGC